jgi:hypothetical protein
MNANASTQLQTSASELTPEQRLQAGHGGSYTVDPKSGSVTLNESTAPGVAGNKHPDAPRNLPAASADQADHAATPAAPDSTGYAG